MRTTVDHRYLKIQRVNEFKMWKNIVVRIVQ